MTTRSRLAREVIVSLNDNVSAFGYSILITAAFALMQTLDHKVGVVKIFAGAGGSVVSFLTFEAILIMFFHDLRDLEPGRNRFVAALMRVVSVPGGMAGALLCGYCLNGPGAWFASGFVASFLFLVLDGIELVFVDEEEAK